jgi:apolipoprotein N-acyltransferase
MGESVIPKWHWPRVIRLPIAAVAGTLMALGHAPFSFLWVSLAGLMVFFAAVMRADSASSAGWTAWVAGVFYFGVTMHWIVEPFQVDPDQHAWMAPFALFFLATGLALFWGGAGRISAWAVGPERRALAFALALSIVEVLRSFVFTGLPWGLLGGIWINWPGAAWLAWIGPHGLTFLTLLFPASVFLLAGSLPYLAIAMIAVGPVALTLFGAQQSPAPEIAADAPIIRLVQPNAPQHLKWDPDWTHVFFERQLQMTAAEGVVDLTVWPETAVALNLPEDDRVLRLVSGAAQNRPVIIGLNRFQDRQAYNTLNLIGQEGEITQSYEKSHLVPFGEYVPFGDQLAQLGIVGLASRGGYGFTAGSGPDLIDLGALGTALPLICYEAIFPNLGRDLSRKADFMLQITNDAWFGNFAGPQQHLDLARMRAMERGLPLVRVANTGISAIIDARGRIMSGLPLNEAGFIDLPLPKRLKPTLYAQWGEIPLYGLWICAALAVFTRRRARID